MKPENAIEWLNKIMPEWDYEANLYCSEPFMGLGEYVCTEYEGYVFKAAIEALEKQIPQLVANDGMRIPFSYYCPNCKEELSDDGYKDEDIKYCPNCGQALKWD